MLLNEVLDERINALIVRTLVDCDGDRKFIENQQVDGNDSLLSETHGAVWSISKNMERLSD